MWYIKIQGRVKLWFSNISMLVTILTFRYVTCKEIKTFQHIGSLIWDKKLSHLNRVYVLIVYMHVTITPDAPHISYCKKKNVTTIIDVLMLYWCRVVSTSAHEQPHLSLPRTVCMTISFTTTNGCIWERLLIFPPMSPDYKTVRNSFQLFRYRKPYLLMSHARHRATPLRDGPDH